MQLIQPINTVELFPPLSHTLIMLLKQLAADDWANPTACANWNVKQVALHLLGGNFGRISERRDELDMPDDLANTIASLFQVKDNIVRPGKKPDTFAELVEWIDYSNAAWVQGTDVLDTATLIWLLEWSDAQVYQRFKQLDPDAAAGVSVMWAGETSSRNWFDIAREYTEKWLHQQHIREAVGTPLLDSREFLYPVLDTFIRALPYTYREVEAPHGTALGLQITGEAGGSWWMLRQDGSWALFSGSAPNASASVTMPQDLAWRLFTKGVSPQAAHTQIHIVGDHILATHVIKMVSLMA